MIDVWPLRILLAGYGTVGKALHKVLDERRDRLRADFGLDPVVVAIARRGRVLTGDGLRHDRVGEADWRPGTAKDLVAKADADVLVEVTPTDVRTGEPGLSHIRAAIARGMHVVAANKGPFVVAAPEIRRKAAEAGVLVRHEATVAAAVPVLNAARHAFAGDTVLSVEGILNGTSNFILTRMVEEASDFKQALREAQTLGYAEADASADVDGWDAAAKIVILANTVLGREITLADVEVTGISAVTREAVELAATHQFRIRLIAEADRKGKARVGPRLVKRGDTLDVPGALNAVRFRTELAGAVTHIGKGAGGRETAAALLSDLVAVAREGKRRK